jgi:GxxExxY protein
VDEAELNGLSKQVLDAAFAVHTALGPGLLESTYRACLAYEVRKRGMRVETEVAVPVVYDQMKMVDVGYRMDMLVEGELVVEIKSFEAITPMHKAQLLTYLKHSKRRLGLLLNFKEPYLKDGICRMVNRL